MFLLVIGGLRRLAGLFVPGAFGVIVTVVPFAWKPITENSWMLWVILIVAAAILVWVALRLEQFKNGARSASSWMKELK
jgi:FtsH-binding integral membrane protein